MRLIAILTLSALFVTVGCCDRVRELNKPHLPQQTTGWQKIALSANVTVYGDFVIHKGESVNDGEYGIEVINLFPATCSVIDKPGEDLPSAELKFFKMSDNSTICHFRFMRGSTALDTTVVTNPQGMIWSTIEINEVNSEDNWVHFNLRLK